MDLLSKIARGFVRAIHLSIVPVFAMETLSSIAKVCATAQRLKTVLAFAVVTWLRIAPAFAAVGQ